MDADITFVATYFDKGTKGQGKLTEKTDIANATNPNALWLWAIEHCPAGKELAEITCSGALIKGNPAIWNLSKGWNAKVRDLVFAVRRRR